MADVTTPAYQYTPLSHPESIRILVLHPAQDRDTPIVCSFLDENPIVPTIEGWECRAVDPDGCTGDCFYSHIDEESHHGSNGKSLCDSAEDSEDEHADERQELAIENMDHADDNHDDKPENEGDDGISTDDTDVNFNKESNESNDEVLCCECGYDKYEKEHGDEENDDGCPCDCHNDEPVRVNSAESVVSLLPTREWHKKVFRPPGFPEYEALSYTWGDASDSLPVMLGPDGAQVMVTPNCFGALQNLRLQTSDRLLWNDAICINQKDDLEKTGQVRMMGRVYAASYRVVICLGDETPSSRLVFKELALAEQATPVWNGRHWHPDRPKPRQELIEAMDVLLERPWFHRVWVLQEAKNSKLATLPDPAILCGPSLSRSSLLVECVFGYTWNRVTKHLLPFSMSRYIQEEETKTLLDIILATAGCAATDSRDRIFALEGLMREHDAKFNDLISYTDGFELTFLKVAQYLLDSRSDLALLSTIRHPHQMNMPSWVPPWTHEFHNSFLNVGLKCDSGFAAAKATVEIRFEACTCARCTGKHAVLRIRGFQVSIIERIGKPFTANEPLLLEEQVRGLMELSDDDAASWDYLQSPQTEILDGSSDVAEGCTENSTDILSQRPSLF
ncbi:Heterokaryon incompatibility protein 6, OR allele [Colletotrichum siamense]|uniref:Heterokaryon incompatibility protein 6, OR allele n=1 Tax=Colletotrichum siamense TaxID=690259 RepID=UPI001872DE81|nr:Heterokaryon incompatibility protein 6, OR allele [Colletotrichum siamense]KAF5487251.1 Heterokaryon incompatibility protein 6, OR allele [Colletotrichum siamense]